MIATPLPKSNLNLVRDVFLFSAFTGISFSDLRNLTERNLAQAEDGTWWIHSARQKTGTPFHVPLLELPLELIEKYRQKRQAVSDVQLQQDKHLPEKDSGSMRNQTSGHIPPSPAHLRNPVDFRWHFDREHRQDDGTYKYHQFPSLCQNHR